MVCPVCDGSGKLLDKVCPLCDGEEASEDEEPERTFTVSVARVSGEVIVDVKVDVDMRKARSLTWTDAVEHSQAVDVVVVVVVDMSGCGSGT